jgi:hypothetical protein
MKFGFIYMIQRPKNNPRNGGSGSPRPKEFETQKSSGKMLVSVCCDRDGILLVGATTTFWTN